MLLVIALSFVKLCDPYEKLVMLLKSRSHTLYSTYATSNPEVCRAKSIDIHPKMFYSYTGNKNQKYLSSYTPLPLYHL